MWLKVLHWLLLSLVFSHSWFRLSRPSDGGRGNHETAGHWAGRRNAKQHSHIHRGHHSVSHCPNITTEASDDLWYDHRRRGNCHWNWHAAINRYDLSHIRPQPHSFNLGNFLDISIIRDSLCNRSFMYQYSVSRRLQTQTASNGRHPNILFFQWQQFRPETNTNCRQLSF